jgi:hypothetical protein
MNERHRRAIVVLQGILVPVGLSTIAWAAIRHGDAISPKGSLAYFAAALGTLQLSLVIYARRLQFSLATVGINLQVLPTMRIAMQSLFYFFFVPLSTGAELSRWAKIKTAAPEASNLSILTALTLDRLVPAAACVAISLASLPFVRLSGVTVKDIGTLPVHPATVVAVLLVAGVGAGAIAIRRGWIAPLLAGIRAARNHYLRGLLFVGVTSLVVQLLSITTVWLLSRWLGIELGFAALALGTSGGMLAQVIPISLAGAGPAELGSGLLFAACGATTEEAVLLTTVLYLCKLFGAVEGGLLEFPVARLRVALQDWVKRYRSGPGRKESST